MGQIVYQRFPLGGDQYREDEIGPFTTDENAWRIAEDVAEKHTAGWIFHLAGIPVPEFELATQVRVTGLTRRNPHPRGEFSWQCEGAALLIYAGLEPDPAKLGAYLSDYRTMAGRIDKARSASTERARLICAELEAGAHPQTAFDRHKLPAVTRDTLTQPAPNPADAAALAFYREMLVRGEVAS